MIKKVSKINPYKNPQAVKIKSHSPRQLKFIEIKKKHKMKNKKRSLCQYFKEKFNGQCKISLIIFTRRWIHALLWMLPRTKMGSMTWSYTAGKTPWIKNSTSREWQGTITTLSMHYQESTWRNPKKGRQQKIILKCQKLNFLKNKKNYGNWFLQRKMHKIPFLFAQSRIILLSMSLITTPV